MATVVSLGDQMRIEQEVLALQTKGGQVLDVASVKWAIASLAALGYLKQLRQEFTPLITQREFN